MEKKTKISKKNLHNITNVINRNPACPLITAARENAMKNVAVTGCVTTEG